MLGVDEKEKLGGNVAKLDEDGGSAQVRQLCATGRVRARVCSANWRGRVARSRVVAKRRASVPKFQRRNMSLVTMPHAEVGLGEGREAAERQPIKYRPHHLCTSATALPATVCSSIPPVSSKRSWKCSTRAPDNPGAAS